MKLEEISWGTGKSEETAWRQWGTKDVPKSATFLSLEKPVLDQSQCTSVLSSQALGKKLPFL